MNKKWIKIWIKIKQKKYFKHHRFDCKEFQVEIFWNNVLTTTNWVNFLTYLQISSAEVKTHSTTSYNHDQSKMKSKSISALVLLTLIGLGFLLFGLIAVVCGFVLNFLDDFDAATGGKELEATVLSQCDYAQYWLGFPVSEFICGIFIQTESNDDSQCLPKIIVYLFHSKPHAFSIVYSEPITVLLLCTQWRIFVVAIFLPTI